MENDIPGALNRLNRARDQILAALAEHLDGDAVRDAVFLDQPADKIELDLGSRREADLDLLEADAHQQVEELEFFLDIHGDGERLVAIAQVDTAPDRRRGEGAAGPLAVGQGDGRKRPIFRNGS